MNWEQFRTKYMDSLHRLNAKGWVSALKGFDEFEYLVIHYFPEGYENPLLLGNIWDYVRDKFSMKVLIDKKLVSTRCWEALHRAIKLIEPESREAFRAWSKNFYSSDERIQEMFRTYMNLLAKNKWEIKSKSFSFYHKEIIAVSGNKKIFVDIIRPFVSSPNIMEEFLISNYHSLIGTAMSQLIDRKISEAGLVPVILFSNDDDTLAAANKYLPYLKKVGIKVYAIGKDEDIIEL